jgi:hypothetical protein
MKKEISIATKVRTYIAKRKEIVIAVVAILIILGIYFSGFSSKKSDDVALTSEMPYVKEIQLSIQNAVVRLSGDKKASVVIGWADSGEIVTANTSSENGNSSNTSPVVLNGTNGAKPIILKEIYPKAVGAVVICNPCDAKMKVEIVIFVSDILELSPERISVCEAKC